MIFPFDTDPNLFDGPMPRHERLLNAMDYAHALRAAASARISRRKHEVATPVLGKLDHLVLRLRAAAASAMLDSP